jgi:transglutaminase-like putative cysteine protease
MEARVTGDDPDSQVAETIELMARYVREDARAPEVQAAAAEITSPGAIPQEDIEAIFYHVKRLIRFQHDETTAQPLTSRLVQMGVGDYPVVEVLIRPRDMVTWRKDTGRGQVGDCDDFAMLTAALLLSRNIKANFVTAAADYRVLGQWSHVYVAAYPQGGARVAMDTSHGEYPGWEVQGVGRKREWPIEGGYRGLVIAAVLALVLWAQCAGAWWKRERRFA